MGLFSSLFGKREPQPESERPPDEELDPGEALDSPDGALRVDAARVLIERWRSGDVHAAEVLSPRLGDLLEDPEPLVRAAALSGVRLLRKPENLARCESAVLALLADPVPQVRTAAIWSALRLPGEAARARVARDLVARLESDADDRPIVAEWAGRLGVQEAIPALDALAGTDGDAAQGAAIRALGRLKAPGAEQRLIRIASDGAVPEDLRM